MTEGTTSPGIGHNGADDDKGVSALRLQSFVQRIERLEEEKKTLSTDIKEVYAEAKSGGFDAKIIRKVVRMRKQDAAARAEEQALIDIYLNALGDLKDTPLGQSAVGRMAGTSQ